MSDLKERLNKLGDSLQDILNQQEEMLAHIGVEVPKSTAAGSSRLPKQIQRIDWSKVARGVPCEFKTDTSSTVINLGFLSDDDGQYYGLPIISTQSCSTNYDHCQFALNTPTLWLGGECPLPDGVMVKVHYRINEPCQIGLAVDRDWVHVLTDLDIIYYEITGLAEGYEY